MTDARQWRIVITPRALKDLRAVPSAELRRIRIALDGLQIRPPRGDIVKLAGPVDEWRLRVGDWRVRFRYDAPARTVVITRVLPRKDAYR